MIEISLNFDALKDTTGLAQARYLSFNVAARLMSGYHFY